MVRKLFKCLRCGHEWLSKLEHPILCARCHSAYWDIPKVVSKIEGDKNEQA
jgi:transcription elongation factor Elf1